MEIWKLQRPLATNESMPMVLAYTEGKEHQQMVPMIDEDLEMLFGDALKVYVNAYVGDDGILHVDSRAEEQDW